MEKSSRSIIFLSLRFASTSFSFSVNTQLSQQHYFPRKNTPLVVSTTCMNLCRGPEHLPLLLGQHRDGFSVCKMLPIDLSFFLLLAFFVSRLCTQYWAIINRGGWKLLQLEKWAQDMIPPHRMPGRCHWNSLSLSATRMEPIWTPSKVLKNPLFIITVKWWDIVYPDRKINSHLQNACLTVLNVIWFLFKCKM